ncbi:oligosaccharide flippase family protein [Mucilaginibacter glaciei]|uniref:Oligosaccharide flippase family protein n=1 Tax=Mucilaginibacter glaciei TaxID=2772109 RepID=A0A926NPI5_9SPHI|nr:oligosaccharide flippase family protein [Mucilaginibacter glaciei]MBD1392302.1 oligosaccharide flippase family protein [Mucilaginibacter glaciei]
MRQRLIGSYHKLRETNIISNFFNLSGIQLSNTLLIVLSVLVITRVVGITEFGLVMFSSRFAQLAGTVVNYGTSQTGIRDIAFNRDEPQKLSIVFYDTLWIRLLIFAGYILLLIILKFTPVPYYNYILLATPIVLAEVFNPLCFFNGIEKLRLFNAYNLLSNVVCLLSLMFFIKLSGDAKWVNFLLGMANTITYLGLLMYFNKRQRLSFKIPSLPGISKIAKSNFYLTVNSVSVNLQQTIIIFVMPLWGNATLLGAYTLCDRIIGQCRILLITISNALYPNAAIIYQDSIVKWNVYRRKTKYLLTVLFFAGSLLIFLLADWIIFILTKHHDPTAVLFLRIMAFVPTISALNVLNVLDQLLKNNTIYIFRIAVVLFFTSILVTFFLLNSNHNQFVGAFTLIVELCALLMYEYTIKKLPIQHA